MSYTHNTPEDQQAMLAAVGVRSFDELFDMVPEELRLRRDLEIPPALTEMELARHMAGLASRNSNAGRKVCFLGGGSYDHFVPAVVDAVASRSEFYTSYTPYQPEVSQGSLQAMFEYQTLICQLTGMDVSNASLYDGGSAAAEAVLMCMSSTRRTGKVVTAQSVHPEYRQILETFFANSDTQLITLPASGGAVSLQELAGAVDEEVACVYLQHPNFFGCLEDAASAARIAHDAGALFALSFDPISLGLLRRPGDLGADVAVAEGQSLGSPMQFGGPYLGVLACREEFLRRMPGRIVGQTADRRGRRCWVLTLQTREQHIRREKATSNICTNQGLLALRAAVYLAALGPLGLRETAQLCLHKARYAAQRIAAGARFRLAFDRPVFKEFVVRDSQGCVDDVLARTNEGGFLAGVPLGRWYPELGDCFLMAVTEKRTKQQIDSLAELLARAPSSATTAHA
jgi:glycine dehydrogenase subunit 1